MRSLSIPWILAQPDPGKRKASPQSPSGNLQSCSEDVEQIISPRLRAMYMARADNMEDTDASDVDSSGADNWYGCDFCACDETLFNCGDVWLCLTCRNRLEDEIATIEALMEEE